MVLGQDYSDRLLVLLGYSGYAIFGFLLLQNSMIRGGALIGLTDWVLCTVAEGFWSIASRLIFLGLAELAI